VKTKGFTIAKVKVDEENLSWSDCDDVVQELCERAMSVVLYFDGKDLPWIRKQLTVDATGWPGLKLIEETRESDSGVDTVELRLRLGRK
jgi:hypothetical protein